MIWIQNDLKCLTFKKGLEMVGINRKFLTKTLSVVLNNTKSKIHGKKCSSNSVTSFKNVLCLSSICAQSSSNLLLRSLGRQIDVKRTSCASWDNIF